MLVRLTQTLSTNAAIVGLTLVVLGAGGTGATLAAGSPSPKPDTSDATDTEDSSEAPEAAETPDAEDTTISTRLLAIPARLAAKHSGAVADLDRELRDALEELAFDL